jgi:hypothetical protein
LRVELPADVPKLHVTLLYARAMAGDTVVQLVLDASDTLLFTRRHTVGGQHHAYTEALRWTRDRPRFWQAASTSLGRA